MLSLSRNETAVIPSDLTDQETIKKLFASLGGQALIEFERDSLLKEKEALLNSVSWSITHPLRVFGRWFFQSEH